MSRVRRFLTCTIPVFLLVPIVAPAAATNTVETLTTQYEAVRRRIDVETVSAYSNALVRVGEQLKRSGDVDG